MPVRSSNARRPQQLQALTVWDVTSVKSALTALERGDVRRAAMLADAMMRDDRIAGVMETRINAILGLEMRVEPMEGVPASEEAAEILEQTELYKTVLPEDCIREMEKYGLLLNMMPLEITWDTGDIWTPVVTPWHPQFVEYDWQARTFWIQTADSREDMSDPANPWVMYSPMGRHRPYLQGLIRRLAIPYLIRTWVMRDWSRWSEKHGIPVTKAYVPSSASEAHREAFFQDIIDLHQESVIELPFTTDPETGDKVAGFDVEMLEAASQSWQGFEQLWGRIDQSIAITLLGQNLTTQVEGGSLAAANAHERIRRDYLLGDVETFQTLEREAIWVPWYSLNYGEPEDAPKPSRDTSPTPIEQAIEPHHLQAGIFTKDELRGRFGEAPWGEERGGDEIVGGSSTPDPGSSSPPPDPGTRDDDDPLAGNNPAEDVQQAALATPPSVQKAQRHLDRTLDDEVQGVAKAMAPVVRKLLKAVEKANSFEELHNAILLQYGQNATPQELAEAISTSMVLANVLGKRAAFSEVT